MVGSVVFIASLLALAHAKPYSPRAMHVHERRDAPPSGFVNSGSAPADQTLTLRLALVQSSAQGLEDALYAVSTPGSPQYGQHLSKEEVEALVAPSSETLAAVNEWLLANNLTSSTASPAGDWLTVDTTVETANKLIDADFTKFTHLDTGVQAVRTLKYSIPVSLKGHISFIHPTVGFPVKNIIKPVITSRPSSTPTSNAVPSSCATQVTPLCLQAQYGIPATRAKQSSNQLGVSAFDDEFASNSDLQSFLEQFRPDLPSMSSFKVLSVDGGQNDESQPGIEANLDIQYTVGIASGVPNVFVSVGDNNQDGLDGFLDEIHQLLSLTSLPQVLTTSYGFNENDLPIDLATNLCNAYSQLGARGVSILFASGDGGVSGGQSQGCTTFVPVFPGTCPFVTSVGGTQGVSPKIAASLSSGGFSNYFARLSYQANAVSSYLRGLGNTNAGLFNKTSRAFPDIAAPAENVVIAFSGQFGLVAGTSCASPIFASVIALINDQLITAGKKPLGFLNPFIYKNPGTFHDITSGNNPGCNTNGFPAKAGWDPVTGFGSPNFAALKKAVGL